MTVTLCLCVEHFARLAFELSVPPAENQKNFFFKVMPSKITNEISLEIVLLS